MINWKHYLTENKEPSAKLIVEAANIFITPEARKRLGDAGTMIVKDSSANKAGVETELEDCGSELGNTTEC